MNIYLVTGSTGFPYGTATANRIRMIGKAFIAGGYTFNVLINTVINNKLNIKTFGNIDNINYYYLNKTTNFKKNKFALFILLAKGYLNLFVKISKMKPKSDIVYIYSQGGLLNPITLLYCKLFKIKTIQEINEWYHRQLKRPLSVFIMEKIALKYSQGAIVISSVINNIVKNINPKIKTIIIPVIEDPDNFTFDNKKQADNRYCFWMGQVDGFIHDIEFIIKGLSISYNNGFDYDFYISGPYTNETKKRIFDFCVKNNYPQNKVYLLGFINDTELRYYCKNAHFYVVPLWDDSRSNARFPTKIASFLFCGKPVLTSKIGDVGSILVNNETALFYESNNYHDLASKIELLNNNELYNKLCVQSLFFAKKNLGYNVYSDKLFNFVSNL